MALREVEDADPKLQRAFNLSLVETRLSQYLSLTSYLRSPERRRPIPSLRSSEWRRYLESEALDPRFSTTGR